MKTRRQSIRLWCAAALLAVLPLFAISTYAQEPKKVIVSPFTLFAADDLTYLQKGIHHMLTTRLTEEGKVQVLDAGQATDPKALATDTGADYLLTGSITVLGNSVSTDAKVMDLKQNKQVLSFSQAGKDQSAIIDHVDLLAAQVNLQLFGRQASESSLPTPTSQPSTKDQTPSIYQHPEKLLQDTTSGGRDYLYGDVSGFVPAAPLLTRGRRIDFQIQGVSAGDIDGDGSTDLVCIGPNHIRLYRMRQGKLSKMAEMKGVGSYVAVDALDVNGNGKAEIFVTNFDNDSGEASSFVLEWDGKALKRIAQRLNWYFRAVQVPNRGLVMAGQRQTMSHRFGKGIFEMAWQSGRLEPVERLPLPRDLNIYGFAYGNVRQPHDTDIVAYNKGGFIRFLSPAGRENWVTTERYGGSNVFVVFESQNDISDSDYIYLGPRIHLFDMDEDGLQEIFVVNNENSAGVFERIRFYKSGRLEGLKWDDLGLLPQWRTRTLNKYIADFTFGDMDGDGKPEVVAAVVQDDRGTLSGGRSYLAIFKLAKPPKPPEKKEG